jgi:hypothetical protein
VTQHIFPAVKHSFAFFGVQLVNEVSGIIFTAAFISETNAEQPSLFPKQLGAEHSW